MDKSPSLTSTAVAGLPDFCKPTSNPDDHKYVWVFGLDYGRTHICLACEMVIDCPVLLSEKEIRTLINTAMKNIEVFPVLQ